MATVRYLVDDVDAVLPFYTALGFTMVRRWGPPFAQLAQGDLQLWLSGPGSSAARPLADGRQPAAGGWNRIVVPVEAIEATVANLRALGLSVSEQVVAGPGGRQILVHDPSGNPLELFEATGD